MSHTPHSIFVVEALASISLDKSLNSLHTPSSPPTKPTWLMNSSSPCGARLETNGASKRPADHVEAEGSMQAPPSRYESQKRRDWNTFLQYVTNHKPPLMLTRCSGAHVIEFMRYLDQFGKTRVHIPSCPYFGHPHPPSTCTCPLKQAWGSLDALVGRLRAAYEENGGVQDSNPFAARAVRTYLREVREGQAKARGIPYEKKKRKLGKDTPASGSDVVVGGTGNFQDA